MLSWQVVQGSAATVEDLLETPVLYITGRDSLQLTPQQKDTLRSYVEHREGLRHQECRR